MTWIRIEVIMIRLIPTLFRLAPAMTNARWWYLHTGCAPDESTVIPSP
ncbi:MAG: hypothetical protein IPN15_14505 [Saprospiraceae bacterium]|nr:hypothetical protein [Candidatus Vicinibacter affinis]